MGLDFIELIERVEVEFRIAFDVQELESVRNAGELFQRIVAKANLDPGPSRSRSLTAIAFFRIRKVLARELKMHPREIKPGAAIEPHLPVIARRGVWRRIQARAPLRVPDLRRHDGLAALMLVFCIAVAMIPAFESSFSFGSLWQGFGLSIWGVAVWAGLLWVTPIFNVALPKGVVTFGDLARAVRGMNYGELMAESGQTRESEMWGRLAFLIADQLGVDAGRIAPEECLNAPAGMIQSTRGQP